MEIKCERNGGGVSISIKEIPGLLMIQSVSGRASFSLVLDSGDAQLFANALAKVGVTATANIVTDEVASELQAIRSLLEGRR